MDAKEIVDQVTGWLLTGGVRILIIVALTLVALPVVRYLSNRLFSWGRKEDLEYQKRMDTLSSVIRYILTIAVLTVAAIMALGEVGVEVGPILAAAGIVGLAVGFGAQSLVQDVISGFFILLEDQIRVGDVVQVGDKGGLVEKMSLRMVVLRDLAGVVHYVRNGQIQVVSNMTKEYGRYIFDIGVAYREDVDHVIRVIQEVDEEIRAHPEFKDDILEPIEILGLDEFGDSAVVIKARNKTKPIRQWAVGREFNRLLKKRFDQEGIEIPFPHVTMYMGQDKAGQAPPLRVKVQEREAGEQPS
ncbi:MAG: mechanosensitive ion channel family protein [Deltaproteobacteria bacterium]|nr:mechanosensitive ion channel family protein [Deltaproteobacteria bacterium]